MIRSLHASETLTARVPRQHVRRRGHPRGAAVRGQRAPERVPDARRSLQRSTRTSAARLARATSTARPASTAARASARPTASRIRSARAFSARCAGAAAPTTTRASTRTAAQKAAACRTTNTICADTDVTLTKVLPKVLFLLDQSSSMLFNKFPNGAPSGTTPNTGCRRWWRGTARRGRSTAGVQRARRQDPGPLEAAPGSAGHLLFAPSRRRRDLDGRHPAQAGRQRERHHRRLHDERQPGGIRPRRAPPSRLPPAAGGGAAHRRGRGRRAGRRVDEFLAGKRPGDVDTPRCRTPSGSSARPRPWPASDARLDDSAARFLNLPFYQTGTVKKAPVGPADVAIVRALLEELSPDLVFVAGDLSDPHGTHRMCKEAIDRALAEYVGGRRSPPRGVALPGRVAGMAGDRRHLAGAALPGGAPAQDPGDLQAPEPEGLGARFPGRTSGSSGNGSRRGTRARRRSWTGWVWRSTSRWRPTSWKGRSAGPVVVSLGAGVGVEEARSAAHDPRPTTDRGSVRPKQNVRRSRRASPRARAPATP